MTAVADRIKNEIESNDVVLYMKGTRAAPQCGFSAQTAQVLDYLQVEYKDVDVLASDELRQGVKDFADWPTIPQLYVKGEFMGGCDIVREMFQSDELQEILRGHGLIAAAT